jgi:hypothetical protein
MSLLQRALWLLAGLTAVALLFASQLYVMYSAESVPIPFRAILAMQMGHWYWWALAGPLAWSLATRWPLGAGQRLSNGARHAATAAVIAVLVVIAYGAVYQLMIRLLPEDWFPPDRSVRTTVIFVFGAYFHVELLVYAAVVAVAHAVRSSNELREREREALQLSSQLATARLQVLRAQLQPHFLFNTLHTVGSLILQRNGDEAMRVLAELGDLLRMTLDRQNAELVTLGDELEHLKRYLRIEETRFGDRLTVRFEVEPAALEWRVPPLILQPLVENALKHGVAARIEEGALNVRAAISGESLRVSIYNDGPLLPRSWTGTSSFGFGLRNVHERLTTVGRGCSLTVENAGSSGVVATVELTHA